MEELLIKYFKDCCSVEEREQAESFKNEHPKEFEILKKLWSNRNEIKLGNFDTEKAWQHFLVRIQPKSYIPVRSLYYYATRVAASLALLAITVIVLLQVFNQQEIRITLKDKQGPVFLEDGSSIWLNDGATFQYPEEFSNNIRKVTLKGEAFFDIAKDTDRPFIVTNEQTQVKVLGTSFNVDMSDSQTTVSVATGKVEVSSIATQQKTELAPGQAVIVTNDSQIMEEVDPNFQSWKTGEFLFDNASIDDVLHELKAYYSEELPDRAPETDCALTATIKNMSIEEVKLLISQVCEIEFN